MLIEKTMQESLLTVDKTTDLQQLLDIYYNCNDVPQTYVVEQLSKIINSKQIVENINMN